MYAGPLCLQRRDLIVDLGFCNCNIRFLIQGNSPCLLIDCDSGCISRIDQRKRSVNTQALFLCLVLKRTAQKIFHRGQTCCCLLLFFCFFCQISQDLLVFHSVLRVILQSLRCRFRSVYPSPGPICQLYKSAVICPCDPIPSASQPIHCIGGCIHSTTQKFKPASRQLAQLISDWRQLLSQRCLCFLQSELTLIRRNNIIIDRSPCLSRLCQSLLGKLLEHNIGPLCGGFGLSQFGIKVVLTGTCPVEHIRKHLARLNGLVDRLGQTIDGDRVSVPGPGPNGGVGNGHQLLLAHTDGLKIGGGRGCRLGITQHGVQPLIGLRRLLRAVSCLLGGDLQSPHDLPVFLRGIHHLSDGPGHRLYAGSDCAHCRTAHQHSLQAAQFAHHIVQTAHCIADSLERGCKVRVIALLGSLLDLPAVLVDGGGRLVCASLGLIQIPFVFLQFAV